MKSVLISIQPMWCYTIAIGRKTLELRKSRPKLETPFKCYIYCTKEKKNDPSGWMRIQDSSGKIHEADGKVIGEFLCNEIKNYTKTAKIPQIVFEPLVVLGDEEETPRYTFIPEKDRIAAFISFTDLVMYSVRSPKGMYENPKPLYGWRIDDMKIYDEPKEISEFYKCGTLSESDFEYSLYDGSGDPSRNSYASYLFTRKVRRPPQSWCYVEEL
ncbi:MAG: hypothetical protein ACI3VQ_00220 [Faecousia sp.]